MPALTNTQRQARYRDRQRRGELRRVTVVLPLEEELLTAVFRGLASCG